MAGLLSRTCSLAYCQRKAGLFAHDIGSYEFMFILGLWLSQSFMAHRADTYSCSIMHSASDVGIVVVEWLRCVPCNTGVPSLIPARNYGHMSPGLYNFHACYAAQ